MSKLDWQENARCAKPGVDPEIFFGSANTSKPGAALDRKGGTPWHTNNIARAKAVCRACPVREQCLAWAVEIGDDWAILGGMTPVERVRRFGTRTQSQSRYSASRSVICPSPGTAAGVRKHEQWETKLCSECEAYRTRTEKKARRIAGWERMIREGATNAEIVAELGGSIGSVQACRRRVENTPPPIEEGGVPRGDA